MPDYILIILSRLSYFNETWTPSERKQKYPNIKLYAPMVLSHLAKGYRDFESHLYDCQLSINSYAPMVLSHLAKGYRDFESHLYDCQLSINS